MNVILPTVIIIFFAVPGLVFRRSYFSDEFSINDRSTNIENEIFGAVIPSLFFHFFYRYLITLFTSYDFNFEVIGNLISGSNEPSVNLESFQNIGAYYKEISFYFLITIAISFFSGTYLRKEVIHYDLDIRYNILKFPNQWYYFFPVDIQIRKMDLEPTKI